MADHPQHTGVNWKLLISFAEGKATAEEQQAVIRWIGEAPEERGPVVDELTALYRNRSEADKQLSDAIFRRFRERYRIPMDQEEVPAPFLQPSRPRRSWRIALPAAAALALVVASTFLLLQRYRNGHEATAMKENTSEWKELNVRPGHQMNLTLADGSVVRLSPGSSLKYPVQFNGRNREVQLEGEAFFQIERDTAHPFIVHTGKLTTRVLGTSFLVEAYKENYSASVTVITGKVAVSKADEDIVEAILEPNQQAIFNAGGDSVKVATVSTDVAWAIKDGKLVFDHRSIREVAAVLQHRYGVVVHLEDESAANLALTAVFEGNISLPDLLKMLEYITDFRIRQSGNDVYIGGRKNK